MDIRFLGVFLGEPSLFLNYYFARMQQSFSRLLLSERCTDTLGYPSPLGRCIETHTHTHTYR